MKKMNKVGGVFFSLALAGSCIAAPCAAWADGASVRQQPESKGIPSATLPTSGYITGAATRAAMPAPEILGLASVEEAGQFVDTVNWYTWSTPKYILSASTYTNTPSPYLANLALSSLGLASTDATHLAAALNTGRNGNGAGPGAALADYGEDPTDNAVWALHPDVVIGTGNWAAQDTSSAFAASEWTVANSGYSAGVDADDVEDLLEVGRDYFDIVTAE